MAMLLLLVYQRFPGCLTAEFPHLHPIWVILFRRNRDRQQHIPTGQKKNGPQKKKAPPVALKTHPFFDRLMDGFIHFKLGDFEWMAELDEVFSTYLSGR